MRRRPRNSCARSIPPSSCTTPRPNSPTAASSASAPRSASPLADSMRAGRWVSSSSPPSSTACVAPGRSGREIRASPRKRRRPSGRSTADDRSSRAQDGRSPCGRGSPRACCPRMPLGCGSGLFGGTFDPPHEAHLGACLLAMKRLNLDQVWWLVTPGNPLKDTRGLAPLAERIVAAARAGAPPAHPSQRTRGRSRHPLYLRHHRFSASATCPGVRFVWIMGADNLRSFHRWQKWRGIAAMVPIAVIDRLGPSLYAVGSPAGQALARARIPEAKAKSLPDRKPPAWVYLHGLKSPLVVDRACAPPAKKRCQTATQWRTTGTSDPLKPVSCPCLS